MPSDARASRPPNSPDQVVVDLRTAETPAIAGFIELDIRDVNMVVQELFSVGLTLAACVPSVERSVADRLTAAVEILDDVIAHVQLVAFGRRDGLGPPSAPADRPEDSLKATLSLLNRAARNASRLVEVAVAQRRDPSEFIDAAQSIYRAMITLTNQHGVPVRMIHDREAGRSSQKRA
jgi:hypothetical protein